MGIDPQQQGGDVAEAEDDLGIGPNLVVVKVGQDAGTAPVAPHRYQGIHPGVSKEGVHVSGTDGVGTPQKRTHHPEVTVMWGFICMMGSTLRGDCQLQSAELSLVQDALNDCITFLKQVCDVAGRQLPGAGVAKVVGRFGGGECD